MKTIKPNILIGLTKDAAIKLINEANMVYRITRENDEYFIGTCEINVNRANLEVKDGIVVTAAFG